jgi:hypothetical protein
MINLETITSNAKKPLSQEQRALSKETRNARD